MKQEFIALSPGTDDSGITRRFLEKCPVFPTVAG